MPQINYTYAYITAPSPTFNGDINDGITESVEGAPSSEYAGWQNQNSGANLTFSESVAVGVVRVFYHETGSGGITQPEKLAFTINGTEYAKTDFSEKTYVATGFWGDIYYTDIPVGDTGSNAVFEFERGGEWTMIFEVDIYTPQSSQSGTLSSLIMGIFHPMFGSVFPKNQIFPGN